MKQTMRIHLLPEKAAEKPLRDILGINNTPRLTTRAMLEHDKTLFEALNFGHIRFHDAPNENPQQLLMDIHRIFPLFHLDEADSRNYIFSQTDDYLSVIADSRAQIDFRLGETIDHSGNARLIGVPDDIDKWARICRNIIGHYKNGEMDGMHLNITRVTVWEEPDNCDLLTGSVQQYSEMFCAVYKLLKKDFPDLQIGGPTMISNAFRYLEDFLTICKQNGVTPDYITATIYARDLDIVKERIAKYREVAEKVGFFGLPIHITEWHLGPVDWKKTNYMETNGFTSAEAAAYAASTLADMMDIEYVEAAYYYSWATMIWSVLNFRSDDYDPFPVYYGLLFFQKLAVDCTVRVAAEVENGGEARVLAGRTAEGKLRLLVSCYGCEPCTIVCSADTAAVGRLYAIRSDYREADCTTGAVICAENGQFSFEHDGKHGVYLLEMDM